MRQYIYTIASLCASLLNQTIELDTAVYRRGDDCLPKQAPKPIPQGRFRFPTERKPDAMTVGPRHRKLLLVAAAAAIAAAAVLVPTVGGTPPGDLGHDFPLPEDATIVPDPPRLIGFDPPSGSNDNMPSIKGTAADAETVRFYGDDQ